MFPRNKIISFKQKFLIIIFINLILLLPLLFFDLRILDKIFGYKNKIASIEKEQQELISIKEKLLKISLYFEDHSDSVGAFIEYIKKRKNLLMKDSSDILDIEIFLSNLERMQQTKDFDKKYYNLILPYEQSINLKLNLMNNRILFYLDSIARIIKILNWLIFFEILVILSFSLFLIYYVSEKFLSSLIHIIKAVNYDTLSIGKLEIKQGLFFSELADLLKKLNNVFLRVSNILLEYKQKINHQQSKVDFFINFLEQPIFFIDENFKLLHFNKLCGQYLGFTNENLGKSLKYVKLELFNEVFNLIYNNQFNIKVKSKILSTELKKDTFFIIKNFEVKSFYQEFLIIIYI